MVSPKSKGWLLWDPVTWRHLPSLGNVAPWSSLGCSLSWQSSLRRCQSDAAPAAAGVCDQHGGGSRRSAVTPSESPSRPTLLSCSQHSKHTLPCLISQQRQQQPLPDICWHVASEKIVGASPFLMRAKPSFHLHRVAVLIVLVIGQHCWSHLTKAKASSPNSSVWIQKVKFHINQCCCCLAVINTKINNWKECVPSFQIQTAAGRRRSDLIPAAQVVQPPTLTDAHIFGAGVNEGEISRFSFVCSKLLSPLDGTISSALAL